MSADDKNFEFLKKIVVENTNTGSNDLKDFSYGKKDIDLGKKKYISEKGRIVYKKKYCMELYKLYKMLSSLKQKNLLPYDQLKIISDYYYPIFKEKYDDYNKREKDIESLFYIAQRYKKLGDFLSDFTIEPVKESQIGASLENKDEDRLTLSTIHSAKGLEWHTVFVIYMVDGYLPSTMSMGSPEELEEERRLLYVALTRAKENLYLIKPNNSRRGGNYFEASYSSFSELTRFLREKDIIDLYTEKWVLTE
ncbi:MAG TPA: ATP-dependent helicase [Actinobacteria bacterium]|nr:ATP-dependent helicase [Actinomycetota bacterium]